MRLHLIEDCGLSDQDGWLNSREFGYNPPNIRLVSGAVG